MRSNWLMNEEIRLCLLLHVLQGEIVAKRSTVGRRNRELREVVKRCTQLSPRSHDGFGPSVEDGTCQSTSEGYSHRLSTFSYLVLSFI